MGELEGSFEENEIRNALQEAQTALNMPEAIIYKLVDKFIGSCRGSLEKLAKAVEERDFEEIRMTAHNIKGSSATLRFDAMSHVALGIESKAKALEEADYAAEVGTLSRYLSLIEAFCQKNRP